MDSPHIVLCRRTVHEMNLKLKNKYFYILNTDMSKTYDSNRPRLYSQSYIRSYLQSYLRSYSH